jgi:ABC-type glycerol-3-phosphate transport system substrate-binding protein
MKIIKRKLSLLAMLALVGGCSSTLISCGNINQTKTSNDLDQVIEVKDLGFIDYDIKSTDQALLESKVLEAVNKKNPGLNLKQSSLDYDLVYKNKTGNF